MHLAPSVCAALAVAAVAFTSGCAAPQIDLSAMAAVERAGPFVEEWAEDAVLVGVVGVETRGLNETVAASLNLPAETFADADFGDGRMPIWYVAYISPTSGKRLVLAVTQEDVRRTADAPAPNMDVVGAAAANAESWTVDSTDALQAARTNATLDAALASATMANVVYGLDLGSGAWTIQGNTDTTFFQAAVSGTSGEVVSLQVRPGEGIKPYLPPPPLPAPIHKTASTSAAADPLNLAGEPPCSAPTSACDETPFTLSGTFDIEATLTWTLPANDYDMYVLDAQGEIVLTGASDVTSAGSTSESLSGTLEAGDYSLVVVPWSAAQDTFTLDATFS